MRYSYPANLEAEKEGGFTVTFDGLPGATWGKDEAEALRQAADLLVSSLSFFVDDGKPIPVPGEANGRSMVSVTVLEAAKLALHDAMVEQRVSNVELGRRLDVHESIVRRLRDPLHRSHGGQVEVALRALGRQVVLEVAAA